MKTVVCMSIGLLVLLCETAVAQWPVYGPYGQFNNVQQQAIVANQQRMMMRQQMRWQQQQYMMEHPELYQQQSYGYYEQLPQPTMNHAPRADALRQPEKWRFEREWADGSGDIIGRGPNNQQMRLKPGLMKGEWEGEARRGW